MAYLTSTFSLLGGVISHPLAMNKLVPRRQDYCDTPQSATVKPSTYDLEALPDELLKKIAGYLPTDALPQLSMASKNLREKLSSNDNIRDLLQEKSPAFVDYFLDLIFKEGETLDLKRYATLERQYGWLFNILPREVSSLNDLITEMTSPLPINAFGSFNKPDDTEPDPRLFFDWLVSRKTFYRNVGSHHELRELLSHLKNQLDLAITTEESATEDTRHLTKLKQALQGDKDALSQWEAREKEPLLKHILAEAETCLEEESLKEDQVISSAQKLQLLQFSSSGISADDAIDYKFILATAYYHAKNKAFNKLHSYLEEVGGLEHLIGKLAIAPGETVYIATIEKLLVTLIPPPYLAQSIILRAANAYRAQDYDKFFRELSAFGNGPDILRTLANVRKIINHDSVSCKLYLYTQLTSAINHCEKILRDNGVFYSGTRVDLIRPEGYRNKDLAAIFMDLDSTYTYDIRENSRLGIVGFCLLFPVFLTYSILHDFVGLNIPSIIPEAVIVANLRYQRNLFSREPSPRLPVYIKPYDSRLEGAASRSKQIFSLAIRLTHSLRNSVSSLNRNLEIRELQCQWLGLFTTLNNSLFYIPVSIIKLLLTLLSAPFFNHPLSFIKSGLMDCGSLFLQGCIAMLALPLHLMMNICLLPLFIVRGVLSTYISGDNADAEVHRHCRSIDRLARSDDLDTVTGQAKINRINQKIQGICSCSNQLNPTDDNAKQIYKKLTTRPLLLFAPIPEAERKEGDLTMAKKLQLAEQQFKSVAEDAQAYIRSFGYSAATAA